MERRRSPRADARLSMRLEGEREAGAREQLVMESQNISSSGVYCLSEMFLPPLSKVNLTLVLPRFGARRGGNELIKCEGIVVRCDPQHGSRGEKRWELACMFSDLDAPRRARLAEFVTWRNLQMLRAAARAADTPRRATRRPRRTTATAARSSVAARPAARPSARAARANGARRRTVR